MKKDIDFKKIIEAAAAEVREDADRRIAMHSYSPSASFGAEIKEKIILAVWNECLRQLDGDPVEGGPLAAEKVVVGLGQRGISRGQMPFKSNSFRICLKNHDYRVYKRTSGFAARPWYTGGNNLKDLKIDADEFAEFLLEFDSWIPEILLAVDDVYGYYREMNREIEKKEMVRKILVGTVESIIEQRLRSLGLTVNYRFVKDGESVSLDIWQIRHGNLEIPINELSDRLRDPDAILDSLVTEESLQELSKDFELEPTLFLSGIRSHWNMGLR